jgi:hypothetical protein
VVCGSMDLRWLDLFAKIGTWSLCYSMLTWSLWSVI